MFNARQHRESNPIMGQGELPVGHYLALVEEIYDKTSSTGFKMLTFKVRILDSVSGSHINALQWENLVIGHESEMTRRIALDKLADICLAHGIESFVDVADLARQIGNQKVAMTVGRSRMGKTYTVFRPARFFFDRKDGLTGLQVAKRAQAIPAAVPPQVAGQPVPPSPAEPLIDFDDELPF